MKRITARPHCVGVTRLTHPTPHALCMHNMAAVLQARGSIPQVSIPTRIHRVIAQHVSECAHLTLSQACDMIQDCLARPVQLHAIVLSAFFLFLLVTWPLYSLTFQFQARKDVWRGPPRHTCQSHFLQRIETMEHQLTCIANFNRLFSNIIIITKIDSTQFMPITSQ